MLGTHNHPNLYCEAGSRSPCGNTSRSLNKNQMAAWMLRQGSVFRLVSFLPLLSSADLPSFLLSLSFQEPKTSPPPRKHVSLAASTQFLSKFPYKAPSPARQPSQCSSFSQTLSSPSSWSAKPGGGFWATPAGGSTWFAASWLLPSSGRTGAPCFPRCHCVPCSGQRAMCALARGHTGLWVCISLALLRGPR